MEKVIAITLYRRPEYTQKLFDALTQCYGIEDYEVFISCDYNLDYLEDCRKCQDIAKEFAENRDAPTNIWVHEPRLGIDLNKLFILPKAFEVSDYVIFLEDDTIPSRDALRYFEWGRQFQNDQSVVAICGYERYHDIPYHNLVLQYQPYAVIRKPKTFSSWGWALWKDRYERIYDMDGQRYKEGTGAEANGRFDWWLSWEFREGDVCIFPRLPRIQSIGGVNGEHTPNAQWHLENEYNPLGAWSQEMPDECLWTLVPASWDEAMKELKQ